MLMMRVPCKKAQYKIVSVLNFINPVKVCLHTSKDRKGIVEKANLDLL